MDLIRSIAKPIQVKRSLRKVRKSNYYEHFYNDSLSILEKDKIIYTEVSKVACTKIKKTLYKISQDDDFANIDSKSVHRKKCNDFKGANDFSDFELHRMLNCKEFYKFCFVRNPYSRAVSAYNDKIFFPFQTKEYTRMYYKILKWAHGFGLNRDAQKITFDTFIRYICNQDFYDMDRHWMPQHIALWHPLIDYDYIGRYENFTIDFENILKDLNASEDLIKMISVKENVGKKLDTSFSDETAGLFYRKFETDFKLYDYDMDSWKN